MSTWLGVVAAVYGISILIVAGGSIIWAMSPDGRQSAGENTEVQ